MNAVRGRFAARTVRVKAPGKVNVSLDVGPVRADGYHPVASVYLAVSLYEEVAATSTEGGGITVSISPASTLDLDGVEPTAHPLPLRNVMRDDVAEPSLDRAEVLAAAPLVEDGRFSVPPVRGDEP